MNINSPFISLIREGARRFGLSLEPFTLSLFWRYYEHLTDWNVRVNLISGRDLGRFVEYHILDALKVASVFEFSGVHTMMDLGSGSGVPGIPFAIVFPGIETTLVQADGTPEQPHRASLGRRGAYLVDQLLRDPDEVVRDLSLRGPRDHEGGESAGPGQVGVRL